MLQRNGIRVIAALVMAIMSCDRDPAPRPAPEPRPDPTLEVLDLAVSAATSPRRAPLIAGERLRIDVRIRGGRPPYQVALHADAPPGRPGALPAIEASTELSPSGAATEAALGAALRPDLPSGLTRLRLTVTDASGARAHADSADLQVIGDDAPLLDPEHAEGHRVLDLAGRQRAYFFRGEAVVLEAELAGDASSASVSISTAHGDALLATADRPLRAGRLRFPLIIPRLAPAGDYRIRIAAAGQAVSGGLAIRGEPFAPVSRLTAEALAIRGGPDGMAPRAGRVAAGEPLTIEVRIGGARGAVDGRARLRAAGGSVQGEASFARSSPAAVGPGHRFFAAGTWTVPRAAPGRYTLEVEVTEGDDISSVFRPIVVE